MNPYFLIIIVHKTSYNSFDVSSIDQNSLVLPQPFQDISYIDTSPQNSILSNQSSISPLTSSPLQHTQQSTRIQEPPFYLNDYHFHKPSFMLNPFQLLPAKVILFTSLWLLQIYLWLLSSHKYFSMAILYPQDLTFSWSCEIFLFKNCYSNWNWGTWG